MKINNKTKYSTRNLRTLFCAVLRKHVAIEGASPNFRNLNVNVVPARKWASGLARINGARMIMRIPPLPHLNKAELAALFDHELYHIRGLRHDVIGTRLRTEDHEWAREFRLEIREPKKPQKRDRASKHAHAVQMYESKLKERARIDKLVKKWKTKVRYYERTAEKTENHASPLLH